MVWVRLGKAWFSLQCSGVLQCTAIGGRTVDFGVSSYDGFGRWLQCKTGQ
jgi:hypothetical protein